MNKKALGLSALGLLVFTAPAFAQDTDKDKPAKTKTTQSGDVAGTTTDQEKGDKTTKKNAKGDVTSETTEKSKHPGTGGSGSKTTADKEKTDSSGKVKEEKTKN